jgi:biphenyl 2,3-dioxygenase subunit beta
MICGKRIPVRRLAGDDVALLQEVQAFLAFEAWLLDHEEFDDWLTLLDPKIRYFAPVRSSVQRASAEPFDQPGHGAHFDETIQTLTMRVRRLATGQAWTEDPRSRVRRFVSHAVLLERSDDMLVIGSNVLIHREGANERVQLISAYREDRIARVHDGGHLKLNARTILIDHLVPAPLSLLI